MCREIDAVRAFDLASRVRERPVVAAVGLDDGSWCARGHGLELAEPVELIRLDDDLANVVGRRSGGREYSCQIPRGDVEVAGLCQQGQVVYR